MNTLTSTVAAWAASTALIPQSLGTIGDAPVRAFGATRAAQAFSLEWAAGFADGEACIHIARQAYRNGRRSTFRLRVYVTQNDREVLEHFRDGIGIAAPIYRVKRRSFHNKQVYTLNYEGAKALALVSLLLPMLVRKQEEAKAALAFWFEGRVGFRPGPKGLPPELWATRERYYLKLRSLK